MRTRRNRLGFIALLVLMIFALTTTAFAASVSEHVKLLPDVYLMQAGSHISMPMWVLFTLPLLPDAPCHPL